MSIESKQTYRLIIEFETTDALSTVIEFLGRSLDNGVLKADFVWGAESVETFTEDHFNDD